MPRNVLPMESPSSTTGVALLRLANNDADDNNAAATTPSEPLTEDTRREGIPKMNACVGYTVVGGSESGMQVAEVSPNCSAKRHTTRCTSCMGNRISVPIAWRPTGSFDDVQSRRQLVARLAHKTGIWLLASGGIGALFQVLRQQRAVGRLFPNSSLIQLQDAGLSLAHAVVASGFGIASLL